MPDPTGGVGTTALIMGGTQLAGNLFQSDRSRAAERGVRQGLQAGAETLRGGQAGFEESISPFLQFGQQAINPLSQLLFNPVMPQQAQAQAPTTSFVPDSRFDPTFGRPESGSAAGQPVSTTVQQGPTPEQIAQARANALVDPVMTRDPIERSRAQMARIPQQAQAVSAPASQQVTAQPAQQPAQQPVQQPGQQMAGGDPLLAQVNPLVDFLRSEGFEDIQESAAARGRLGAGGTLQDLTRFNTQLTSTVVPQLQQQRFNQLFNAVQLGAGLGAQQGTARLGTAQGIANIQAGIGQNAAQGDVERGNIITGGLQNLAGGLGQLGASFF